MLEAECGHASIGSARVRRDYLGNHSFYEHTNLVYYRSSQANGVAMGTTSMRGWILLHNGLIDGFLGCFDEEEVVYFGCQLRYFVFLFRLGRFENAISFAVDESLNRCSTDVCERVILMSRLRHCITNTLDDTFTILATTVTERGLGIEYPWSRQA